MADIEDKRNDKDPVEQKFSSIGWGIFAILVGVVMILPHALVPEGFLWVAAGAIMIIYRAAVVSRGIDASFGLVIVGGVLIVIGISDFIDMNIDLLPVLLIVGGVLLLGKAMNSKA